MIGKFMCWLGFHDWGCVHTYWWDSQGQTGSTVTGWQCHRCYEVKTEQWDG